MMIRLRASGGYAGFLAAALLPGLPRVAFDRPNEGGGGDIGAQVLERIGENHTETKGLFTKADTRMGGIEARVAEVEQKMARRGGGDPAPASETKSIGERFTGGDEFKAYASAGMKGTVRMEVKTITSATGSAGGAQGGFVTPDRQTDPIMLPRRQMTIRDLVQPGRTASNSVHFLRQTLRQTAAAPVAENPSAIKPQSDYAWQEVLAPVKTIAHWVPASRQVMEDAPALQSIVDGELRYGLDDIEELQLLLGDGTGENLLGLMPQATAFVAPFTIANPTMLDVLLQALAQADASLLPADGIVLNTLDHRRMQATKDAQGRYIGGGPYEQAADRVWQTPKVATNIMPQGSFLVGAFSTAAQIFDRLDAEVLASSEDRDNFVRNMWTIRAEKRLAFAVKRPNAFIKGTFPAPAAN